MPEPVLGINFARNGTLLARSNVILYYVTETVNFLSGMEVTDWLSLCAIHSDSWLMALLFFFGARFNYAGRAELFALANQHPTIYEVVTERVGRNTVYKRQDASGNAYIPESFRRVEEPAIRSQPSGRIISPNELTTALCGKKAELYWPDDGKWYLVEIQSIDMDTKMAKCVVVVVLFSYSIGRWVHHECILFIQGTICHK